MSRVYPGTNTPSRGIRAVAGTVEPEEPAALVPPPVHAARLRDPRGKPSAQLYRDLTFLLADSRVDKLLTADKPFPSSQLRQTTTMITGNRSEFVESSSSGCRSISLHPRFSIDAIIQFPRFV